MSSILVLVALHVGEEIDPAAAVWAAVVVGFELSLFGGRSLLYQSALVSCSAAQAVVVMCGTFADKPSPRCPVGYRRFPRS